MNSETPLVNVNSAHSRTLLWPAHRHDSLRRIYQVEPFVAAATLLAAAPGLLAVAATIALLSRRAPLIRHRRVGLGGAELPLLKFRTMWDKRGPWTWPRLIEDVSATVPIKKEGSDERVSSRFAAWCRRYSIDELPQLYHVARGEMSFVGPRPITRAELDAHYGESARIVLTMRPGLTGLWQVAGRSRLTYAQRKRLDLRLVRSASPQLYFRILWRSVPQVLSGSDAH